MRFRNHSNSHYIWQAYRDISSEGAGYGNWSVPQEYEIYTRHEDMLDVVSDRANYVHPVQHRKFTFIPGFGDVSEAYDPTYTWYRQQYMPPTPCYYPFDASDSNLNPLPSSGVQGSLHDDAFMALSTQVPQEVDVFNFLYDFKEISSLIPSLQENLLKTVSGGYLTYAFGWKPMLADIKKLGTLTTSVANRLKWLRETRGKHVRLGFSASYQVEGYAIEPSVVDGPYTLTPSSSRGQFRAGGILYHELDRLEGVEGQLRAFTAALGLNSPSRVAWERIPWSFAVDWFARTQSITESLTVQPYPGTWQVTRVSHSFKQRVEYEVVGSGFTLMPFKNAHFGTLVCESYMRGTGLPASSSILDGEVTTGQLVLAAALIGAASR